MGQKADNKVAKQMQSLWKQKINNRQTLSDDEINDMLSSDERVDKLYHMMKGEANENRKTIKLSESKLREIVSESVRKVLKEEPENILHWYDNVEETYDIAAMIKSDMNPIQQSFKAKSLQDAIQQAMKYFVRFTRNGEKDVDIYYIKHHGYDGI